VFGAATDIGLNTNFNYKKKLVFTHITLKAKMAHKDVKYQPLDQRERAIMLAASASPCNRWNAFKRKVAKVVLALITLTIIVFFHAFLASTRRYRSGDIATTGSTAVNEYPPSWKDGWKKWWEIHRPDRSPTDG
jgi:hypothetical protein